MKRRRLSFVFCLLFILCLCPGAQAKVLTLDDHLAKKLTDFIASYLSPWGMDLAFDAVDSTLVEALSFQQRFQEVWQQQSPSLVTDLKESDVSFEGDRSSYTSSSSEAKRPGVHVKVAGREWGDMLAMSYSWNYTWAELKELLGDEGTGVPEVSRLFEALTVIFNSNTGSSCTVVGKEGVDAAAAAEKRALVLTENGTGISVTLNVCLTNIWSRTAKQSPQFVEDLLIVPDGVSDTYIVGTMWIVEKKADSNKGTPSSSSGGGGCNAGLGGVTLIMAGAAFLRRRSFR